MRPNAEQELILMELEAKNRELRMWRLGARARIEKMLEQESMGLLVQQSQIAVRALQAGVSKSRIGKAMGTTNGGTVNQVLSLTTESEYAPEEVTEVRGDGWSYAAGPKLLTLTSWRNRMHVMQKDPIKLELKLDETGRLWEKNYGTVPTLDQVWLEEKLRTVSIAAGYRDEKILSTTVPAAATAQDEEHRLYDEMIRRQATDRSWEDEED